MLGELTNYEKAIYLARSMVMDEHNALVQKLHDSVEGISSELHSKLKKSHDEHYFA